MNVVIDTNVLISALKSNQGASYKLIMALPKELYTPNVSVPLFLEYESVAKRQGLVSKLSSQDIDSILEYFLSKSSIRKIFFLWRPYLKDPKDDLVLEVAVESQSEYIVTFNTKDFKGCNKFGITVVTPQEFIAIRGI
ncbi:MAG: putative toxin-antitoxin system toxin component, PIN family [Methyloprofundus sp.]|nr:putative toxin-antitoxin system toxin component, PIN family [Methyloprofundus sp.]